MNKILLFSLLMMSIAACNAQMSVPTSTSLPASPTSIVTVIPIATNTPVVIPTNEPIKPVTETTPSPVVVTQPTVMGTAAPLVRIRSDACSEPNTYMHQVSPDGQQIAIMVLDPSFISIISCDGKNSWEISFEDIADIPECMGYIDRFGESACFYGILYPLHWDKDSRYVFVDVNYIIDRPFDYSYGLYRLDTKTHQISPWLKATQDFTYVYAFSPDNSKYAYQSSADEFTVHVNSIESGQNESYKIPGDSSGIAYITWSPDNQKVAFSILHEGWFEDTDGFSLAVLDLKKGEISVLIPDDKRQFYPTGWASDNIINLSNRTSTTDYQYDLQTNKLSEVP